VRAHPNANGNAASDDMNSVATNAFCKVTSASAPGSQREKHTDQSMRSKTRSARRRRSIE
jgi:hypothetical protein